MKKQILLGCFLLLCLLCGFVTALLAYQNESQLIQTSDQIVYGKIVDVKSAWNGQKTHIETTAQILVNDSLKNNHASNISPGNTILVSVTGGTIGNYTEMVEDTPTLIKDTDAIFFLKKKDENTYSVINLYSVTNGKIGESTPSGTSNDIAAFKQKITALEQGNTQGQTTTTQKAGMSWAPFIATIGILSLIRKNKR